MAQEHRHISASESECTLGQRPSKKRADYATTSRDPGTPGIGVGELRQSGAGTDLDPRVVSLELIPLMIVRKIRTAVANDVQRRLGVLIYRLSRMVTGGVMTPNPRLILKLSGTSLQVIAISTLVDRTAATASPKRATSFRMTSQLHYGRRAQVFRTCVLVGAGV